MGRIITVQQYQTQWQDDFNKLSQIYSEALKDKIIEIHHIGSTSVPDLAAKPRIDIDIEIQENDLNEVIKELERISYKFMGELNVPDRYAFKYIGNEERSPHNLYVCPSNSLELKRHLAFRDYLRTHHEAMKRYSTIKLEAIKEGKTTIEEYMDHKGPVIVDILEKAFHWAGIVPKVPKGTECSKCGSDQFKAEFKLRYIGDGNKSEYFAINCSNCRNKDELILS